MSLTPQGTAPPCLVQPHQEAFSSSQLGLPLGHGAMGKPPDHLPPPPSHFSLHKSHFPSHYLGRGRGLHVFAHAPPCPHPAWLFAINREINSPTPSLPAPRQHKQGITTGPIKATGTVRVPLWCPSNRREFFSIQPGSPRCLAAVLLISVYFSVFLESSMPWKLHANRHRTYLRLPSFSCFLSSPC